MSAPNVRKYTREQLLKCYRRFACPEGVEQHTAIYSLGTLLPEQLSHEPNFSQVLSVAHRTKRQISDLATRPRDPNNRAAVQVSYRPSVPGGNGGRAFRGPPTRGWGPDDDLPPGRRQQELWDTFGDSPSERFGGMQTWAAETGGRAPSSRIGRGLISSTALRQPDVEASPNTDCWAGNGPALSRPPPVVSPHTAASWEKLGQKIAASPKIASLVNGKDIRSDLSTSPPPAQSSSLAEHHQMQTGPMATSSPEQEPSWMTELRRRFPNGLPEHVLQTLLGTRDPYNRGNGEVAPPSESSAGERFAAVNGNTGLNFKDLLHKAHGAPPAATVAPMPRLGVVAASGMGLGEGPVISRVVRWSDNRPLYVVESISRAQNLSVERDNARHTVEYATDQYEARIILENYETRVAKLYQELLDVRRLWLPDPLAEHLGINDNTSIALWPSFRELFTASQSEGMSRKLQTWEARQAQRQAPTQPSFSQAEPPPPPAQRSVDLWVEPCRSVSEMSVTDRSPSPVMPPIPSPAPTMPPESNPAITLAHNTVAPTGYAGDGAVTWYYLDPLQTIRGPYGSQKMFDWWQKNYFPPDLPVRLSPEASFAPLSTLYPPELQSRHRPFLSPPPLLPQQSGAISPKQPSQQAVACAAPKPVPSQSTTAAAPAAKAVPTATISPQPQISPYSQPTAIAAEVSVAPPVSSWEQKRAQDKVHQQQQQQPQIVEQPPEVELAVKASLVSSSQAQSLPPEETETFSGVPPPSPPPSQAVPTPAVRSSQPSIAKTSAPKKKPAAPPSQIPERPQAFVQKHDTPALQPVVENRPVQSVPWARKKVALDDIDSSDETALGPSLDESRLQDVLNRGAGTVSNAGVAKAVGNKKAKAKPKKQTLLEILSDQQADDMANFKSPWGVKAPSPTTAWGDPTPKRSSPEPTAAHVVASAGATAMTMASKPAVIAPKAQPKAQPAVATNTTQAPVKAAPAPMKQTPITSIVEQSLGASTTTDSLNFCEPVTLNANQRKEISLLCAHHGIDLDADFLGVLASCETAGDMNAVLRDNLPVKDVQAINAFVEDFWDLVQNPFKPVKKGVTNTITPKAANKKRSGKRR